MSSPIDQKFAALGGAAGFLGTPTNQESTCPDGIGRYRHYQHGSIYWSPATGAHEVHGLIRQKWAKLGWEKSPLGYPKSDETATIGGRYSDFQGGVVLWKNDAAEAFSVLSHIRGRYIVLNSEKGFLGFPITDEGKTPDGAGRYNHFEHGSIYWKPSVGAHEVHGLIRKYWADHGWEKNPELGYPLTNETPTKANDPDRFNDFENGVVYWKSGTNTALALKPNALASRSKAVVAKALKEKIDAALTSADSRVYITSEPTIIAISDYAQKGSGVRNRMYTVAVAFAISLDDTNDPDCSLTVDIELKFDRPTGQVQAILRSWHIHTEVDWPTNWFISAEEVNAQLKPKLDALVGVVNVVGTIPSLLNVLSVKVMPNGDLDVFVEP